MRRLLSWPLLLAALCALGPRVSHGEGEPAVHVQVQPPARLEVEADGVEEGAVVVRLSGQLRIRVTVEAAASLEVEPLNRIAASPAWAGRPGAPPEHTPLDGGRVRWRQEYLVEPLKPEKSLLQLAPLRYRERPGEPWREVAWRPVPVRVTTAVGRADVKDLRDIAAPEQLPVPPPWPRWWLGAGLAAVLLVGLGLGGRALLRRRAGREPALPPDAWALAELDRLTVLGLPAAGEVERFHTLLSDVVRRYLEMRYQLPARRQTTVEFLQTLRTSPQLSEPQQVQLGELLARCDLAKFARAAASPEQCQVAWEMARELVVETTRNPVKGPEEG